MTAVQIAALFAAGMAAGCFNVVIGAGSLVTFPVLLACGYPPVTANITNNVGIFSASLSGIHGYRRELRGQRARMLRLGPVAVVGSLIGCFLLLHLPSSTFDVVVPVLIVIACVLVAIQPRLVRALARRRRSHPRDGGPPLAGGVVLSSVYGGYFGAAQGIILLALLGPFLDDDLQRINALKNFLAGIANGVGAVVFAFTGHVVWGAGLTLAVGALLGGQVGARVGRRLSPNGLRIAVVGIGLVAFLRFTV